MRKIKQQKQQEREDELRRDECDGFVMEKEDKLAQEYMFILKDIARQVSSINRRTEKNKVE